MSGCTTSRFQASVGEFGRLTDEATHEQAQSLATITSAEDERIRAGLASSRADLSLSPGCAAALGQPMPGAPPPVCGFTVAGKPIEQAARFANIQALSGALNDYAVSLIALAADRPEDEQAFTQSLSGLATSLSSLDASARKFTGSAPADHGAKLGAIASLVAEGGRGLFAFRRAQALRRIVTTADPIVQDATTRLFGAASAIDLFGRSTRFDVLNQAQVDQAAIVKRGEPAATRAAQDRLFMLLAEFNSAPAITERFVAIGNAHAAIAKAARQGASAAEIKQAALALFDLAKTIDATARALHQPNKDPDNGN